MRVHLARMEKRVVLDLLAHRVLLERVVNPVNKVLLELLVLLVKEESPD